MAVLVLLCAAQFMVILDITVVNGDAFRAGAAITLGAGLLALTALRRRDVAPGTRAAFAH